MVFCRLNTMIVTHDGTDSVKLSDVIGYRFEWQLGENKVI